MEVHQNTDLLTGTLVGCGTAQLLLIGGAKTGKSTLGWLMKDLGAELMADGFLSFQVNGIQFNESGFLHFHYPSLIPELNNATEFLLVDNQTKNMQIRLPIHTGSGRQFSFPDLLVWLERTSLPVYSLLRASITEMESLVGQGSATGRQGPDLLKIPHLYRLRIPADLTQFRRAATQLFKDLNALNLLKTANRQQGQS